MNSWHASLALDYRFVAPRTALSVRHHGPLRVQKALYPEGDATCHTIMLHPPGGIAGGDALSIKVDAQPGAHALITTPGAAKWYKANGRAASQRAHLRVKGALEWLPQEAIVFDQADVHSEIHIDVERDARMIGWDIVALGRMASGEAFTAGCFAQSIRLYEDGALQWVERTRITGGDALLASPIGLAGHRVFACVWAIGPHWGDERIAALRECWSPSSQVAITQLTPRLLVARVLGSTSANVRRRCEALWQLLRPGVLGVAPVTPRIWAT